MAYVESKKQITTEKTVGEVMRSKYNVTIQLKNCKGKENIFKGMTEFIVRCEW